MKLVKILSLSPDPLIYIGTGIDISMKDLALLIKKIVEYEGALYFNSTKPDGTMVKLTNSSKLHTLGWKHKIDLEEGIKKVYRSKYKNGSDNGK